MIKEFCGGKAGWNDRAIFIETVLQASVRIQSVAALWSSQICGEGNAK